MQEFVTYTIKVPTDVDALVRSRWPDPGAYLSDLIASAATDQKRVQASREVVTVKPQDVVTTSDAPEDQGDAQNVVADVTDAQAA